MQEVPGNIKAAIIMYIIKLHSEEMKSTSSFSRVTKSTFVFSQDGKNRILMEIINLNLAFPLQK